MGKRFVIGNDFTSAKSFLKVLRSNLSQARAIIAIIILYAFGVILSYSCINQLLAPMEKIPSQEKVIRIEQGMGVYSIGLLLKSNGLVRSPFVFQLASIIKGSRNSLKAGDYSINDNMSVSEIIKKISAGDTITYKFTIPEGLTIAEIAEIWENEGFGSSKKFVEASSDPLLKSKYNIEANSIEGYLFPDTYIFSYGTSEHDAIEMMLSQFSKRISELLDVANPVINMSLHEIISLASIIEKEAKINEERPIISAVFRNRLKLGMKLESCSTVLYGLGYPDRKLTYDDLRDASMQYNTYVYSGLPPGPICNPGLSSIMAAINPSDVEYLYFVSKNDGTHHFTENYNDFLSAKRKYQSPKHS